MFQSLDLTHKEDGKPVLPEPLCRLGLSSVFPPSLPLGLCHTHAPVSHQQSGMEKSSFIWAHPKQRTLRPCVWDPEHSKFAVCSDVGTDGWTVDSWAGRVGSLARWK